MIEADGINLFLAGEGLSSSRNLDILVLATLL
jgi:hypothetical protein